MTIEKRRIKLSLHPKQMEVYQDKHRFRVVTAGRRFGKCVGVNTYVQLTNGKQFLLRI